jgi:hypothetical protein
MRDYCSTVVLISSLVILQSTGNESFRTQMDCDGLSVKEEARLKVSRFEECKQYISHRDAAQNSKCSNGEASMQKSFRQLEYLFSDTKGLLDISEFKNIYSDLQVLPYVETTAVYPIYGNPSCQVANITRQNEMNLCPWHYVLMYRLNRYPHFQTQARCNCKNCAHVKAETTGFNFECKPIIKLQPALIKDDFLNGSYVWKPALEEVSIACACMRNETSISVKKIKFG